MKLNWTRGFDRIAVLIAIPMAILGFFYISKQYSQSKAVSVYLYQNEKDEILDVRNTSNSQSSSDFDLLYDHFLVKKIFDFPSKNGVIAEGREELKSQSEKSPIAKRVLDRALSKKNADPNGALVDQNFGLKHFSEEDWLLIPSKTKRALYGILGAISFSFVTIVSICLPFRVFPIIYRWIKNGFIQ